MKYILILAFFWATTLVAQKSPATDEDTYLREYVKSFSVHSSDTIVIQMHIPYEIVDWDRDIVRVFTQVESFSMPDDILRVVARSGRYRVKGSKKDKILEINLPKVEDKIKVQGIPLTDEVVAKIYVPEGFPLKVICTSKTPEEQVEDLWLQQEILTRKLNFPIKRAINADYYYDVSFEEATILAAETIKGTNRFLALKVQVGTQQYSVVSRIGKFYDIASLVGQAVVFVKHDEKEEIRNLPNQGMVLVRETEEGALKLVTKTDLPDFFFIN